MDYEVDRLGLSRRARNCLLNGGYTGIAKIEVAKDSELLRMPMMGRKTLEEIRSAVNEYRHGPWGYAEFGAWRSVMDIPQRWKDSENNLLLGSEVDGFVCEGRWDRELGAWIFAHCKSEFVDATHWMPLPNIRTRRLLEDGDAA